MTASLSAPSTVELSLEDAAARLGLTAEAVRKRAARGQLPSRHEGRRLLILLPAAAAAVTSTGVAPALSDQVSADSVEAAQAALRHAEAALADIHARLSAGDLVTPDAFAQAESVVRFAQARLAAAERAEAARRADERARAHERARARATAELTAAGRALSEAQATLESALALFVAASRAYDTCYSEHWTRAGAGALPGAAHEVGTRHLSLDGRTYRPAQPQRTIGELAVALFREHYGARYQVDLNQPPD